MEFQLIPSHIRSLRWTSIKFSTQHCYIDDILRYVHVIHSISYCIYGQCHPYLNVYSLGNGKKRVGAHTHEEMENFYFSNHLYGFCPVLCTFFCHDIGKYTHIPSNEDHTNMKMDIRMSGTGYFCSERKEWKEKKIKVQTGGIKAQFCGGHTSF